MLTKDFILAGNATFTIQTPDQGHRTYRVRHKAAEGRWKECWFVDLLTGSDNESDYSYVGKLDDFTGQVILTAKSKLPADAYPVKLLNRVLARVWADDHQAFESKGFKLHHEGQCGRCGRKLTVPESIESGFGPECIKKATGSGFSTKKLAQELVDAIDPICSMRDVMPDGMEDHTCHICGLDKKLAQCDGGVLCEERAGIRDRWGNAMAERIEEKAEFARLEAIQEQLAFASDPDLRDRYGRIIPKDHECYAAAR